MGSSRDKVNFEQAFLGVLEKMSTALSSAPNEMDKTMATLSKLSHDLLQLQAMDMPSLGNPTAKEKMQAVKKELSELLDNAVKNNNDLKKDRSHLLNLVETTKAGLTTPKKGPGR